MGLSFLTCFDRAIGEHYRRGRMENKARASVAYNRAFQGRRDRPRRYLVGRVQELENQVGSWAQ